jgi:hypothetical protein
MYPVGVASPADSQEKGFYFIVEEAVCEGHRQSQSWTIREWKADQGVDEYDRVGEEFKRITLHQVFQKGEQLAPPQMEMLFMALYDLDKFRRFVFESSFLKKFKADRNIKLAKESDLALLELGYRWVRFSILGEPALRVRKSAARKHRRVSPPSGWTAARKTP